VGRVRDVRLRYIAETASLETPVILEVDPRLLQIDAKAMATRVDLRLAMNEALDRLIRKGMRAKLATSLVLPGASAVSLDFTAPAGSGRLITSSDPPVIPSAGGAAGIEGALGALTDVAETIRSLPLREIAGNLRSASARVDALVNDPVLDDSLRRLNRSLVEIEKITATTSENIGPIAESLRNAASAAESAASRAEQLIGTSQKQGYDISELVKELTRAAEAVRALAQYLTEKPDALLKGRPE
jgi:paraquat-inducible protein B